MQNSQLLNNITHKDLKIITKKSAEFGDNVGGAILFPQEFNEAHKEYPIFFQKNPETGEFQSVVLFGFEADENLFLTDDGWQANYIPAVIERGPFLIGLQKSRSNPDDAPDLMIHIDLNSPRVSKDDKGEPVFLEQGGNTPYVERISNTLLTIHEGFDVSKAMFEIFLSLEIIEPFALSIEFNNGKEYKSNAYYTINQERFFSLDDASVGQLHRGGFLHYAYMVLASTSNMRNLIEKKNKKLL